MAFTTYYGLDDAQAYTITGRAVTDDHLVEAEAELAAWLRFDIRDDLLVYDHEQRPLTRALAMLAAGVYDRERRGELAEGAEPELAVQSVAVGDVRVELADGAKATLVDGQLVASRVDWRALARRELADGGLLARRLVGRSGQAARAATRPVVNDI